MVIFEDIEDVTDWLVPLDYAAFWDAVAPYRLFTEEDRDHYDSVIADGIASPKVVLTCLKADVRIALTERLSLSHRIYEPTDR